MKKITNMSVNGEAVVLTIETQQSVIVNNQITTRTSTCTQLAELLYQHDDTLVVYINGKDCICTINKTTYECALVRSRIHMHSY